MASRARPLVHSRADGWLLGGVGVVAWLVVSPHAGGFGTLAGVVTGTFAVLTAMHFGASYHLAYAGGRKALREHPVALVGVPVALVAMCIVAMVLAPMWSGAVSRQVLRGLLVSVFTLTGWHYIKQAFGVAMLSVRSRGVAVSRPEALALRYSLYPIWAFQVLKLYGHGSQSTYRGVSLSVGFLPAAAEVVVLVAALAGVATTVGMVVRLGLRERAVPPAGFWATYLAAALWFLVAPNVVSAGIVLSGVHGLQYLACAHRAEIDRAKEWGEDHLVHWWLCVFGGAAAGGVLATTFLPALLDRRTTVSTVPALYASLVFVVFNLHHYAIDATIWRSGGEHVRRIAKGPAIAATPEAAPIDAGPVAATPSYA